MSQLHLRVQLMIKEIFDLTEPISVGKTYLQIPTVPEHVKVIGFSLLYTYIIGLFKWIIKYSVLYIILIKSIFKLRNIRLGLFTFWKKNNSYIIFNTLTAMCLYGPCDSSPAHIVLNLKYFNLFIVRRSLLKCLSFINLNYQKLSFVAIM